MNNWKTTSTGFLAGVFGLLTYFNVVVPQPVAAALTAIFTAAGFFFAKDKGPSQ